MNDNLEGDCLMVILNPGLSEAKVDKIKESVTKLCGPNAGFCTALQGQIKLLLSSLIL